MEVLGEPCASFREIKAISSRLTVYLLYFVYFVYFWELWQILWYRGGPNATLQETKA